MRGTLALGCALAVLGGSPLIVATPVHAHASHKRATKRARRIHKSKKSKARRVRTRARRTRRRKANRKRTRRRWTRPGFHRLSNGPGFRVMKANHAWGRKHVLEHLQTTFASHHARFPNKPAICVHDLSRRWGGRFRPHKSHRRGVDVDIRLLLDPPSKKYRRATPRTLDLEATWLIVAKLLESKDVVYIFLDYRLQRALYKHARDSGASQELLDAFQYPRGRYRRQGIIRHTRGHADHMHVRFKRKPSRIPTS